VHWSKACLMCGRTVSKLWRVISMSMLLLLDFEEGVVAVGRRVEEMGRVVKQ
jgi:hypothetical protein